MHILDIVKGEAVYLDCAIPGLAYSGHLRKSIYRLLVPVALIGNRVSLEWVVYVDCALVELSGQ